MDSNTIIPVIMAEGEIMGVLSKRLRNDNKWEVHLNSLQKSARSEVLRKIETNTYVFQQSPCIICEGSDFALIAEKDRYALPVVTLLCRSCGLLQTNPTMRDRDYKDFYTNHYRKLYLGKERATSQFFGEQKVHGKKIIDFLTENKSLPDKSFVLEVGCGAGGILKKFLDKGHEVLGLDFDEEYLCYGRERGVNYQASSLPDAILPTKPNVIIYSHVLEHIVDPNRELDAIKRNLAPGGVVYIEVPGIYTIPDLYQGNFLKFLQNAHLFHFTKLSLVNLFQKNGFQLDIGDDFVRAIFRPSLKTAVGIQNQFYETYDFLKGIEANYSKPWVGLKRELLKVVVGITRSLGLYVAVRGIYRFARRHIK